MSEEAKTLESEFVIRYYWVGNCPKCFKEIKWQEDHILICPHCAVDFALPEWKKIGRIPFMGVFKIK